MFVPLLQMLLGLSIYACLLAVFEIPRFGIFSVIVIGLILSVLEVNVLARMPDRLIKWSLLDGKIFPFFSMGIGAGMIIF